MPTSTTTNTPVTRSLIQSLAGRASGPDLRWCLVWCLALVVALAVRSYVAEPGRLANAFGDPDDAVRLYQIRTWMAGAGWFDLVLPRLGGGEPLQSHWSRLIDMPVALLIRLFSLLLSHDSAELAARVIWPTLLLASLVMFIARETHRRAGRTAFWLTLALVATTPLAIVQFQIGRIDHHNAMILCTTAGLILLLRALEAPGAGRAAGALLGIGLTVGLEAIGLAAAGLAAAVLVATLMPVARAGVRTAAAWLASTLAIGFVLSVPPERWLDMRCDALSLNLLLLVGTNAIGIVAVDRFAGGAGTMTRLALLAAAAVGGALLYAIAEPRCLAGPFGMVDPAIKPIWLDGVREGFNIASFFGVQPGMAAGYAVMMVAAALFAIVALRRERSPTAFLQVMLVVLAGAYGCIYVKLMPYALWLAIFVIAREAARLPAMFGQPERTVRLGAVILANQSTAMAVATILLPLLAVGGSATAEGPMAAQSAGCDGRAEIRTLASLPTGLFVADIDLGALIAIDTKHSVFAAPYHRLDRQIIAADAILSGSSQTAAAALGAVGARYAAVCGGASATAAPQTFRAAMKSGAMVPGLERVALPRAAGGLIVYRLATR